MQSEKNANRSSCFTGYNDLDEKLKKLYGIQTTIEATRRAGIDSKANIRIYRETIAEQDGLLSRGKFRDSGISIS